LPRGGFCFAARGAVDTTVVVVEVAVDDVVDVTVSGVPVPAPVVS